MRWGEASSTTMRRPFAAIVRQAPAQDYRISSIILGVVNSQPFQMRKSR